MNKADLVNEVAKVVGAKKAAQEAVTPASSELRVQDRVEKIRNPGPDLG
jgi:hypothetical protein